MAGDKNPEPLTYYHRQSPIGQLFATLGPSARSVGVIGLGAGTLAAYVQPGASWSFYEIDAAVERIARDARYFHYLERCGSQCSIILGDARLTLAQREGSHHVLVLDAFISDAIPMHLLTTEALQTYELDWHATASWRSTSRIATSTCDPWSPDSRATAV